MPAPRPYRADGTGSFGLSTLAKLRTKVYTFALQDRFNGWGGRDHNQVLTAQHQRNRLPGAVNLGHTARDTDRGGGYSNDHALALANRARWRDSVIDHGDRAILANRTAGLRDSFTLLLSGYTGGHLPLFLEHLQDLKTRLSENISNVWFTTLSDEVGPRDRIRGYPDLPRQVRASELVDIICMLDNAGPIARDKTRGRDFLDNLWLTGLASLLKAPILPMEMAQRAPSDVFHELARLSPLCTMSFGIEHLVGKDETALSKALHWAWGGAPRAHLDDPEEVGQACIRAATTALTDPEWRALEEAPRADLPAFCAFTIPWPLEKRRDYRHFWKPLSSIVNAWVTETAPWLTPLFIPGPGVRLPALAEGRPYWAQATLVYAIPPQPQPITEILARPALSSVLQPTTAAVNDGVQASEVHQDVHQEEIHQEQVQRRTVVVRRYRRIQRGAHSRKEAYP